MGNHERYARVEAYTARASARVGIRFLRGEAQALRFGDSTLNLAGLDFQSWRQRRTYLRGAERLILPGATNVLLQHNPDVFPEAARQGYNLLLAGHTHGGQVTVEILDQAINPARFFTPFVYGLYRGEFGGVCYPRNQTIGIRPVLSAPEISLLRLERHRAISRALSHNQRPTRQPRSSDAVLAIRRATDQAVCCGDLVGYGRPEPGLRLGPGSLPARGSRQS